MKAKAMKARTAKVGAGKAAKGPVELASARKLAAQFVKAELGKLMASSDGFVANPASVNRSETRWRGASQSLRSMAGWRTNLGSGRTDTSKNERDRLAARSYDAYRNHLIARAAITRPRTNVVGTGLIMHPSVNADALDISEEEADELNGIIANEWPLYYDNPVECDIEGTLDGYGQQGLALVTSMLGGDCWVSTPYEERPGCIYGLKTQLIDPARVCNINDGPDTATLQDGVELSLTGMPIAIQVRRRHPADATLGIRDAQLWDRREIYAPDGARRIFQVWNDKDRIGMTRGVPYLAPILEPLQMLEQYSRAELIAAVISAMFTVFIKKDAQPVDDRGNPLPAVLGQTVKGEAPGLTLGNGAILDLFPGEEPIFADPSRPNSKYEPFFLSIVRQIGAALEIPLDELMLNYQASYSAARAAMLQAWRFYSMRRWWLVQQFCQPHYRLWFDEAVARGRLPVKNYADPMRRAAYQQATWIGPARGAMDESQEATAAKTRIETGVSNETIETAQMTGENWNTVYRQRRRELQQREADGMTLGPSPGQAAIPGQTPRPADANPKVPSDVPSPEDAPVDDPSEDPLQQEE